MSRMSEPQAASPLRDDPADPAATGAPGGEPPVLLVADDNVGDALLLELACADAGLAVRIVQVRDGAQAWALLQAAERAPLCPYALAMIDLNLPVVDGLELLARMRATQVLAHLPTIIYTTSTSPADQARALRLQPSAYVVKPPDYRGLALVVVQLRALLAAGGAGARPPA